MRSQPSTLHPSLPAQPVALLLAPLLALLAFGCAEETPAPDAPDVVLVVVDTLRADHLGVYGYPAETSPQLDALAEGAAVFDRAIAASTLTAPSHASMMTSRWVRSHSIGYQNGTTRLEGGTTLAEAFQAAGYETAAFIGNAMIQARTGLDRGFELYDDALPETERNRPKYFERTAPGTTERAIQWLEKPRTGPVFLWVHYQDPHGPYTPPSPWEEGIEGPEVPGEQPLRLLRLQHGKRGLPAYQYLGGDRSPGRYRALYAGEIRHFDDWLGRLIASVDAAGERRETIWLVTSDHGESLGEEDYWFAHGHATTPDIARIPLVIRGPGIVPGRYGELVHHVDILPTLLGLAGLAPPPGHQGVDLAPRLRGGEAPGQRIVFNDIGGDVSAYSGDGFLRVTDPNGIASPSSPQWTQYRWSREGALLPRPDGRLGAGWEIDADGSSGHADLRASLERYLELEPSMPPVGPLDDAQLERLRALGYIDPEE